MKLLKRTSVLALAFLIVQINHVLAQCAMCRASIEVNVSDGDTTIGAGLNKGILYLFTAPYLIALVIGFLWYKNAKLKKRPVY